MHSKSTATHNGARPRALSNANAVAINRIVKGRYSKTILEGLSEYVQKTVQRGLIRCGAREADRDAARPFLAQT